jgi:hypothetical protein
VAIIFNDQYIDPIHAVKRSFALRALQQQVLRAAALTPRPSSGEMGVASGALLAAFASSPFLTAVKVSKTHGALIRLCAATELIE